MVGSRLAVLLGALLLLGARTASALPFPGLVSVYWAEGNALDSAGLWDHVAVGDLGYVAAGHNGLSFSLDGDGDYATLGPVTISNYRQDSAISYLWWANVPVGGGGYVMGANGLGGHGYGGIFLDAASGSFGLDWTPSAPLADARYGADFSFAPNVWTHFAVVADYDGDSVAFYVNGSLVATSVMSGPVTDYTPASQFTPGFSEDLIGARFIDGVLTDPYEGLLDDIVLYSRPLSGAEVLGIYNEQQPVPEPSTGLLVLLGLAGLGRARRP